MSKNINVITNTLISFREIKITDAALILKWRRKKRITSFQFTDISNSINKQKIWIKNSYHKKDYYHWIILFKKKLIGFFNISKIDKKNKQTSWGWYIGSNKHLAIGGFIPPFFYNWVFKNLKINKLNICVFANNKNIIKINEIHGYKALKKKYSKMKNGKKISYIKMILKKKNWNFDKYKKYVTNFPTKNWQPDNKKLK